MPEVVEDRGLGKGPFGTEKRHLQRLLLPQTRGHDLAEEAQHLLVLKGAGVALTRQPQHLRLALGAVEVDRAAGAALGGSDLLREARPLVDQRMQLFIDGVNAPPHLLKLRSVRGLGVRRWRRSPRRAPR